MLASLDHKQTFHSATLSICLVPLTQGLSFINEIGLGKTHELQKCSQRAVAHPVCITL